MGRHRGVHRRRRAIASGPGPAGRQALRRREGIAVRDPEPGPPRRADQSARRGNHARAVSARPHLRGVQGTARSRRRDSPEAALPGEPGARVQARGRAGDIGHEARALVGEAQGRPRRDADLVGPRAQDAAAAGAVRWQHDAGRDAGHRGLRGPQGRAMGDHLRHTGRSRADGHGALCPRPRRHRPGAAARRYDARAAQHRRRQDRREAARCA